MRGQSNHGTWDTTLNRLTLTPKEDGISCLLTFERIYMFIDTERKRLERLGDNGTASEVIHQHSR